MRAYSDNAWITMPRKQKLVLAFPIPGTLRMDSASMNLVMAVLSGGMAYWPSGLRMSEATLARSLFGPMPHEQVTCTSSRTLRLIVSATCSPAIAPGHVGALTQDVF